jgi:membrane fusion protein, multidrug efflux system
LSREQRERQPQERVMFDADHSTSAVAESSEAPRLPRAPAFDRRDEAPKAPKPQETRPLESPGQKKDEARAPRRRRPLLTLGLLALAAIVAGAGYVWWDNASHYESTDDAFIAARQIAIAPQVTGYVTSVPVTDNQHVEAGAVIARLDDRDYQAALDQADAQVSAAEAGVGNVQAEIDVQTAQIQSSKAQVQQARAVLDFARQQAARYSDLAKRGAGTVENAQQYSSQLDQQQAAVLSAEAAERVAERRMDSLKAQLSSQRANMKVAEAQREAAALNVGYATIRAAEPGRIANLTAAPGEFAQPGSALTMFVPDELWIVANFKETQLDRMRPGQPVTFTIDAYPERTFAGRVASVQPGSGTAFSLLPAQNATGNYVKIVQRVPVKIVFDKAPPDVTLGPGMSVEPTVRVDPSPSLYERLSARARRVL